METKLTLFNLSVRIETNNQRLIDHITHFVNEYYSIDVSGGGGDEDDEKIHTYAGNVKGTNECTFTNQQFKHLIHYLRNSGFMFKDYQLINLRDFSIEKVPYKVREGWSLREKQVPVHKFVIVDPKDTKLLPLSMGSGKTYLALQIMADMGDRFAVIVLPRFQPKWRKDICEVHEADPEDVIMIANKADIKDAITLKKLIECAKTGAELKPYMVFSLNMFYNFIKSYEADPELCVFEYGCTPFELMPLLKIGSILCDELHMHYHQLFKILLYCNVKFLLGLSGTLIASNDTEKRTHDALFPHSAIYPDRMRRAYINFVYATFGIDRDAMPKLRFSNKRPGMRGRESYSHTAFEASIMRDKLLIQRYLDVFSELIQEYYLDTSEPGERLIVFVATIKMATLVAQYVQRQLPKRKVVRYCEDDKYEDMMEGEIIITTVMSAGTGVDIPDLITGIQSHVQRSIKSNLQASGRLRYIEGREVTYICMFSEDVKKQVRATQERKEMFKDFTKSCNTKRMRSRLTLDRNVIPYIMHDT